MCKTKTAGLSTQCKASDLEHHEFYGLADTEPRQPCESFTTLGRLGKWAFTWQTFRRLPAFHTSIVSRAEERFWQHELRTAQPRSRGRAAEINIRPYPKNHRISAIRKSQGTATTTAIARVSLSARVAFWCAIRFVDHMFQSRASSHINMRPIQQRLGKECFVARPRDSGVR
jgi:hypothetical protein